MTCDKCGRPVTETVDLYCPEIYCRNCGHIAYPEPPPPPKWRELGLFTLHNMPLGRKMRAIRAIHAVGWTPKRIADRFDIELSEVYRVLRLHEQMQRAAAYREEGYSPHEIAGLMSVPRDKIYELLKLSAEV